MITHTNDSHQIPSQNKTSQSYKLQKIAKNTNFEILQETLHATHILKLLDKIYKYDMDPTKTVGATERTRDAGRTDRQMEWNQYTPQQLLCAGGIIICTEISVNILTWKIHYTWLGKLLSDKNTVFLIILYPKTTPNDTVWFIRLNLSSNMFHIVIP